MKLLTTFAAVACLLSFNSIAGPIQPPSNPQPCDVWNVHVTQVRAVGSDTWIPVNQPYGVPALSCMGGFAGNNSSFDKPQSSDSSYYNLGYKNDGWMNYYGYLSGGLWETDGAFITSDDMLQDLQGLGPIDPGWVYMGKDDGDGFVPDSSSKKDPITNEVKSYTYEQTVFSMDNCKNKDGNDATCVGGDAISGNWLFSPPAVSPEELFDILGGTFFDQMALVLKAGNAFAMYTFSIDQFPIDPILPGEQKFEFAGTWDMSGTLLNMGNQPAGLSNYSLYGRDPTGGVPVPAPATLGLIGGSLLLMQLFRRKTLHSTR